MRGRFAVDQSTITGWTRRAPDSIQPLFACDDCTLSSGRRCAFFLKTLTCAKENRLHAIWEKQAQLELSLYRANVDWFDAWPVDAPRELRKMAADVLETACELDAIARDLEMKLKAKDEWGAQVAAALVKGLAEAERDRCTQRLGEIVRMSRKPEK